MDLVEMIPTAVTAIATVVVALATVYYARILKNTATREAERPRRMDEINSIMSPLISTCNGEIKQIKHKWYDFLDHELFSEKIQKNNYKKMIFNDFIKGRDELKSAINDHEQIVHSLAEKHQSFVKTINTDDFRMKIKNLHEEFNQNNPNLKFSQDINSLLNQIIRLVIENANINDKFLNDPFKSFWKINRNFFLDMRKKKELKKYLEEIETLSIQLIEKNKFIIKSLEDILNEYTKEYGISLKKELIDFL